MSLGQWIVIGLSAFLVLWYIAANSFNRRRGIATYRWLRQGLDPIGEITDAKWLGSSGTGGRLAIPQAEKPFLRLEAIFLLETREILPYWVFSHLWGRRDILTIKADLRHPPSGELAVRRNQKRSKTELAGLVAGEYEVTTGGQEAGEISQSLAALLTTADGAVESLYLHTGSPHFELSASIKPLLDVPPETFFPALGQMLRDLIRD